MRETDILLLLLREILTDINFFFFLAEISRLIKGGGVYHGLTRTQVAPGLIKEADLVEGTLLLLRVGKSSYFVAEVV